MKINNQNTLQRSTTRKSWTMGLLATFAAASLTFAQFGEAQQQQQGTGQASGDVQQRLAQLQQQLQEVNMQVAVLQREASAVPEVKQSLLEYNETLTENLVELAPNQSDQIERRHELFTDLVQAPDMEEMSADDREKYQRLSQEFQEIRQELGPVVQQANQNEEIQQKLMSHQRLLQETMVNLDPEARSIMETQENLSREFQQLQQQLMQQQQQQQ